MTALGWLGVALLVAGTVAVVIEGVVAGMWTRRLSVRARDLSKRLEDERGLIEADLARLQLALAETRDLWQPYHRALRFLRHPLVLALIESARRRRRAARARA